MAQAQDTRFKRTQASYQCLADFIQPSPKAALRSSNNEPDISHQKLHDFVRSFNLPVANHGSLKKPVVAVLLPNGPLLAATVMATATWYTTAPINPAAGPEQVHADVELAGASAIVTCSSELEKLELEKTGLTIFLVEDSGDSITTQHSSGSLLSNATGPEPNYDQDIGIILFTSGTSGNKKVVPMTTHSIVCGVGFVIDSWALVETDVCLNMMPLYHVGGLIRNIFSPVYSGGSTVCCPGFDPNLFWDVTESMGPTWYYASPSIHSVILEEAKNRPDALAKSKMRLICNAAGGLLPALAAQLRDTFHAIVLPSYGMTECMPISTPPIDYKLDRPGTSGISTGPGLTILDGADRYAPAHSVGRICVRGEPTFKGYLRKDGTIDSSIFTEEGWFDTGDMGYMDEDGYLYITGRNKEVINRGGELISPFEVENAIISAAEKEDSPIHGRVSQALAFSVRHDVLQEVVGVVLVTPPGKPRVDVRLLHDALKATLQQVKWPVVIAYMNDAPKRNGKVLRIKLGERLGLPCMTDDMPYGERHWEAQCPPADTALSVPIPATMCQINEDLAREAMQTLVDPEVDVLVQSKTDNGYLEAFIAPSMSSRRTTMTESTVLSLRKRLTIQLDGYVVPHKITPLTDSFPRDITGNIDTESLFNRLAEMQELVEAKMASSTEGRITKIFANILAMDALDIPSHKDFFEMGGDSLKAGKLLSALRTEFKMHLPVDLIFNDGSVDRLALHIEKHQDIDGHNTDEVLPGCEKTHSSTNPILMLVQLIPMMVVYPACRGFQWSLFIYALSYSQRIPYLFDNVVGRLFCLVLSIFVARMVARFILPFFGILIKWVLIGKHKEGLYPMWGLYHTRWWLAQKITDICGTGFFAWSNSLLVTYYRMMGAKIGSNVTIKDAQIGEWDLLEIGDNATLDSCIARPFGAERNTSMYLGKIVIGKNAHVGVASVVAPGTVVPENTCIGPNSSSWELEDASEENRDRSATKSPKAHWALTLFLTVPLYLLAKFIYLVPWLGGLWGLVTKRSHPHENPLTSTLDWFVEGERVGYHYLARALRTFFGPFFIFAFVILVKKSLDLMCGPLLPKANHEKSQIDKWRAQLMNTLMPGNQLHEMTAMFGQHYEATSVAIRALGGKAGKYIYWPGTGPHIGDYHLIDVGNNVVFGSRSHFITSDATGSSVVTVGDRSMVADRVVMLPGVTIEDKTTMGSGALTRRDRTYESGGTYVGSKGGEAICLTRGGSGEKTLTNSRDGSDSDTDESIATFVEKSRSDLNLKGTTALASPDGRSEPQSPIHDVEKGRKLSRPVSNKLLSTELEKAKQEAAQEGDSSPFGRAFYKGQAPYYVLSQWQIFLYSAFIIVFVHCYWDVASISSVQLVHLIFSHVRWFGNYYPWDPFVVFGLFAILISLFCFIESIVCIAVILSAKWLLMGRRQPGNYDWDKSSYCQRWQLFLTIEKMRLRCFQGHGLMTMFTGTAWMVWYFRAMGAQIGKDCALFVNGRPSLMLTEPDLLTLGDRVTVDDASLVGHINTRGKFDLNRLRVGSRSVLRTSSRLLSGAEMGEDSCLLEHTLIMAGDVVDSGATMQGWPAGRFRGASRVPGC